MKPGSFLTPALDSYALLLQEPGLSVEPRASVWLRSSDPVKKSPARSLRWMPLGSNNTSVGRRGSEGIPARSSSSTCGSCFTSFVSKETDACCVRRRIVIGKNAGTTDTGATYLPATKPATTPFSFSGCATAPWSIYSNAILVTVICTSGFRADLLISAIRRSEFRKAA